MSFILKEKRMLENLPLRALELVLVEVVHVQLSDKRWKVAVFEVLRQDNVTEVIDKHNLEAVLFFSPIDDVIVLFSIDNLIELNQKWRHMIDGDFRIFINNVILILL